MSKYLLTKHVRCYSSADMTVFLDLRRDRYIGITREQAELLASEVEGWPGAERVAAEPQPDSAQFAEQLAQEGLLTQDKRYAHSVQQVCPPPVASRLYEVGMMSPTPVRSWHAAQFTMAFLRTITLMRIRRLDQILDRIQKRKQQAFARSAQDLEASRALLAIFCSLQPFFYTARSKCLFDSLVLLEFFAAYRQFPTWVIGVRVWPFPFEAHSWVQLGDHLLNGPSPSYVRGFAPILFA